MSPIWSSPAGRTSSRSSSPRSRPTPSVNEAERQADYWVFGGIFRPVYLEAYPAQSIDRVAVNAKADGTLSADVFLRAAAEGAEVTARVIDDALAPVGAPMTATVAAGQSQVTLQGSFAGIRPWTAETPHRYRLAVELTSSGGVTHAHRENFGFRTVEVRAGDGIYVNGSKVHAARAQPPCVLARIGSRVEPPALTGPTSRCSRA